MRKLLFTISLVFGMLTMGTAQEQHDAASTEPHACNCHEEKEEVFDPAITAFHHIGDANVFEVWSNTYLPLPCILYAPEQGWSFFMASKFHIGEHGTGEKVVDRYVLYDGFVLRVPDSKFPMGEVDFDCVNHSTIQVKKQPGMAECSAVV